jgi:hypothetical protein
MVSCVACYHAKWPEGRVDVGCQIKLLIKVLFYSNRNTYCEGVRPGVKDNHKPLVKVHITSLLT